MKNKILLFVVILLSAVLVFIDKEAKKNNYVVPLPIEEGTSPITIKLLNEANGNIMEINLEDYVVGVVSAEMPASFNLEALKAQAVAARTYALYKKQTRNLNYDVIIGTKDQAYQNNKELLTKWGLDFFKYFLKVREAVKDTQSEVITYNGELINAFYFSMSNGYTENCELVFVADLPYLNSVPSKWDNESLQNYQYTKTMSQEEFCEKLNITCHSLIINNEIRSGANRVLTIDINGTTWKGTTIRSLLGLRSTDFQIDIKENEINITTKGYGHGVGMSQYGANGMANSGYSYQDILKYYYQNTEIVKINV